MFSAVSIVKVRHLALSNEFKCTALLKWAVFFSMQSYLALPKGGLVSEHVLILPIGHYAASTDAPPVSLCSVHTQ